MCVHWLFLYVYTFSTWNICVHLPPVCFTAAHQCILDKLTSAAMDPKAIMESPTTAELAASQGVRNPSTAAVTQPHWDPSPRVVWTAVFIYKDKDGWRKHLIRERAHFKHKPENQAEKWESVRNLTGFYTDIVFSAALVVRQNWKQFSTAAYWIRGITPAQIIILTAMMPRPLCVYSPITTNLKERHTKCNNAFSHYYQ